VKTHANTTATVASSKSNRVSFERDATPYTPGARRPSTAHTNASTMTTMTITLMKLMTAA
jgi:hypothetical protein